MNLRQFHSAHQKPANICAGIFCATFFLLEICVTQSFHSNLLVLSALSALNCSKMQTLYSNYSRCLGNIVEISGTQTTAQKTTSTKLHRTSFETTLPHPQQPSFSSKESKLHSKDPPACHGQIKYCTNF